LFRLGGRARARTDTATDQSARDCADAGTGNGPDHGPSSCTHRTATSRSVSGASPTGRQPNQRRTSYSYNRLDLPHGFILPRVVIFAIN
jgi:hypothetical protein